jgi:hypothetical protein
MMKGTPCSGGNYAPLKTSSKTRISIDVQGLGPWRGLGQRHNLACFTSQWFGCAVCPTHNTNPAKRVRAWAQTRPTAFDRTWPEADWRVSGEAHDKLPRVQPGIIDRLG